MSRERTQRGPGLLLSLPGYPVGKNPSQEILQRVYSHAGEAQGSWDTQTGKSRKPRVPESNVQ